jgi:hypothetical protein
VELSTIIYVHGAREAGNRPGKINPAFCKPRALLKHGMSDADPGPKGGWMVQGDIETGHHPRVDIDREGQDRAPDRLAGYFVDDDEIHDCVIDLHDVERAR